MSENSTEDKQKLLDMYINEAVWANDTDTDKSANQQSNNLQISQNAPFVFSKNRYDEKNRCRKRKMSVEDLKDGMNNGKKQEEDPVRIDRDTEESDDDIEGEVTDSERDDADSLRAEDDEDALSGTSGEPLNRYGESQPEVSKLDKIIAEVKQDLIKAGLEKEITTPTLTCKMKSNRSNKNNESDSQEMYMPKKKVTYPPEVDEMIDNEIYTGESRYKCAVCGKGFFYKSHLRKHTGIHLNIKPFTCNICGKGFNQNSNMKTHMRTHAEEKPFSCSICDKGFNHNSSLQIHMRTHTGERPFMCKICNKGFSRNNTLKMHEITHSATKPYVCSTCGKEFGRRYVLQRHVLTHTGEKPYICTTCGRAFSQNGDLQKHMRIHTGDKPYVCAKCGRGFCQSSDLIKHRRIHKDEKYNKCYVCGQTYISKTSLEEHMKSHDREHSNSHNEEHMKSDENFCFVCTACGKEFTQIEDFQEHKKNHEDGSQESKNESLSNHGNLNPIDEKIDVHIKQEPIDVGDKLKDAKSFCGDKGKISNKALEIFMNPRTNNFAKTESKLDKIIQEVRRDLESKQKGNEDLFDSSQKSNEILIDISDETIHEEDSITPSKEIINISDAGEKETENLSLSNVNDIGNTPELDNTQVSEFHNNQVAITSDKPYICTVCGKGYNQLGTLTNHFMKHTDTETHCHVCDICGVDFINGRDLARHKKTHIIEKPYECTTCGKEFKFRWDLTKHIKVIHNDDRPYPCTACGKVFRQQCILQAHMRTHTGAKPFGCSTCGEGFSKSSELKKHVLIHTSKQLPS